MEVIDIKIFFGCSSHNNIDNKFINDAEEISHFLSKNNDLIIGGLMDDGMMGKIIKQFKANKRKINLYTLKIYNEDVSNFKGNYKYFDSTFDRTKNIYNDSDIIIILPGGTGTLAELFSILEEKRTIETNKKIIIYNQDGYYYDIIKLITRMIKDNFNGIEIFNNINVFNDKNDLIKYMEELKWKTK